MFYHEINTHSEIHDTFHRREPYIYVSLLKIPPVDNVIVSIFITRLFFQPRFVVQLRFLMLSGRGTVDYKFETKSGQSPTNLKLKKICVVVILSV